MADVSATDRHSVERLADAFIASYRAGQCPSVDQYVQQFPELADDLRGLLTALVILEQNIPPPTPGEQTANASNTTGEVQRTIGDFLILREIGRGGMGIVYEAVQQSLGRHVALKVLSSPGLLSPSHLERFRQEARAAARLQHGHIVPVFGVGEHEGVHYYAMQFVQGQSLDVIIDALRDLREVRQTVDGQTVAASSHPDARGITDVLLARQLSHDGLALADHSSAQSDAAPPTTHNSSNGSSERPLDHGAADGNTLTPALSDTQFSSSAGRRQFYRNAARVGLQVAEALAYAHAEGILHRDIKPSNLLLDAKGSIWVTDFGLAKADGADDLTQTGDFVGTLRYMAPERFEGWSDRRSDLYSLGVTLYELLTLRPMFPNTSRAQLINHITHDSPPAPSKVDAAIPADLETIVLKALAKEPAARYHRAEQMADDLRRFLAGRPILARRATVTERFSLWCRRNPLVASLAGALVLLLVAAVATLSFSNAQIRRESQAKAVALKEKETALVEKDQALAVGHENEALARGRFYAAQINLAQAAWKAGQPSRTVELLETLRPWPDEPDIRGFEWYYLYRLNYRNLIRSWRSEGDAVTSVAWSPDGSLIAAASASPPIRLWDPHTGEHLRDFSIPSGAWRIKFSPDGKLLAAGTSGPAGRLVIWDLSSGRQPVYRLANSGGDGVRSLTFSPDGKMIATGALAATSKVESGEIRIWGAAHGTLLTGLAAHKSAVGALAFSPDGKTLASATFPGDDAASIILWDVESSTLSKRREISHVGANDLAFSEDGTSLYAAEGDGIKVVDVESGTVRNELRGHNAAVNSVYVVPGRNRLVSASDDRTVRLWDLEKNEATNLGAELAPAVAAAVDPKGKTVVTGDNHGWVSLRSLEVPDDSNTLSAGSPVNSIAFSADDQTLMLGSSPIQLLDAATLGQTATGPSSALAISPDGKYAANYDGGKWCKIWDARSRSEVSTIDVSTIDHAAFSRDASVIATWKSGDPTNIGIWDTRSSASAGHLQATDAHCVVFAPGSRQLAVGESSRDILVYDLATSGSYQITIANQTVRVMSLAYAPDGRTLVAGLSDGRIVLLDCAESGSLRIRARLGGHTSEVVAMAISADSRVLATAGADRTIRLWDLATGQERITLDIESVAKLLTFSNDGSALAMVDRDDNLRLFRANEDAAAKVPRTWRDEQDPTSPDQLALDGYEAWGKGDLASAKGMFAAAVRVLAWAPGAGADNRLRELLVRCKFILYLLQDATGYGVDAANTLGDAKQLFGALPDNVKLNVGYNLITRGPADPAKFKLIDALDFQQPEIWLYRGMYRPRGEEEEGLHDLDRALALDPNNPQIRWFRGFTLGGLGRWDEAIAEMTTARRQLAGATNISPALRDWFIAMAYVAKGDRAAYQAACKEVLDRIATERDPYSRETWLRMCTATPYACEDPSRLVQAADVVMPAGDDSPTSDQLIYSAAALYRAGVLPRAQERLERALRQIELGHRTSDSMSDIFARLYLAMTYQRLGNTGPAAAKLAEAIQLASTTAPECWVDALQLDLLRKEAANVLSDSPSGNKD